MSKRETQPSRTKQQHRLVIVFNVFTVIIWGWIVLEFLSRGQYRLSSTFSNLYLILLGYYAAEKEILRWQHRYTVLQRRGELFVYGWAVTAVTMFLVETLGGIDHGYRVPGQLSLIVGAVLVIFVVTAFLKAEQQKPHR